MSHFFLVALFFYSIVAEGAGSENRCRKTDTLMFKSPKVDAYKTAHVMEMARTMADEGGCDDGVYAEQATGIVCQALVNDFPAMIKYGSADAQARAYILKHINATAAESDLVLITRKRGYCFTADSSLCQDVIVQAEKTLQNFYKKSRSFDRKPAATGR